MQAIARELNLSETVFIGPARDPRASHRLRIFTPGMEVPFAGHPTVGTAILLAGLGLVAADEAGHAAFVLEEESGLVPVTVSPGSGGLPLAWFTAPRVPASRPGLPAALAAALLNLEAEELVTAAGAPLALSAGIPFLVIPVREPAVLSRARLDLMLWQEHLAASWAPHVYVVCHDAQAGESTLRARMFAPAMGIAEDPATGAAAAALPGYLCRETPGHTGTRAWTIHQGDQVGRPSRLELEADLEDGTVRAVRVGGTAVRMGHGELEV